MAEKPPANDNRTAPSDEIAGSKCAICSKPQTTRFKPFCSRRCADVDLNRWLTGSYAIPAEDQQGEDDEA
jgi:uncharacterized protein